MTEMTGRQAILKQMAADGMKYMFGNPGTVEQGFLDALRDTPEIHYILGLQESISVAMADAYARAVKRPTLVQLHSGVGLGNGIGMMYQAMRGHAPLVVVAGEAGLRYDAMDAQMACDLVAMAAPVTKWATRVVDPASLLRVFRRAVKIAGAPPMGPVFICLPMDVLDAPCVEAVVPASMPMTRVAPDAETMTVIARMLLDARNPIIIMGDGIAASNAQTALEAVAELVGARVYGADNSEVNFDASHPLYQGNLGHMFGSHSAPIVREADAVLIVGTYVFPEVFPALDGVFQPGARIAHIELDTWEIAKNHPVTFGVAADPNLTLGGVAEQLQRIRSTEQASIAERRIDACRREAEDSLTRAKAADRSAWDDIPLKPARFMEELAARVGDDIVIFDEALTTSPELNRYLPPRRPGHFFQTRGGSLGVGIPGAIGLKLAFPEKPVIGFTGDGGSMYTIQALWTAAKYQTDAKFVVCNNRAYRLLQLNIQQYWRERNIPDHPFPEPFDLSTPPLRFDAMAEAMNVPAARVEKPEDIAPALDRALTTKGPFLIDLVLDGEVPNHQYACHCGQ